MMRSSVVHVQCTSRQEDGRVYAITMQNRDAHGVLVWAGRLEPLAEGKSAEEIESGDYHLRETVSFMSWHDIEQYFEGRPFAHLVDRLIAAHKRNESAGQDGKRI